MNAAQEYGFGRQSVWTEMSWEDCKHHFPQLAKSDYFRNGRRDAQTELKLDADTEWD